MKLPDMLLRVQRWKGQLLPSLDGRLLSLSGTPSRFIEPIRVADHTPHGLEYWHKPLQPTRIKIIVKDINNFHQFL